MVQALILILAALGLWAGYRWLRQEMRRVQSDLSDAEETLRRREEATRPSLEHDPETGLYKPRDDDRA